MLQHNEEHYKGWIIYMHEQLGTVEGVGVKSTGGKWGKKRGEPQSISQTPRCEKKTPTYIKDCKEEDCSIAECCHSIYGAICDDIDGEVDHEKAEVLVKNELPKSYSESDKCLTDGSPVTSDHREINSATGQQKDYVVLTPEERSKGYVRPYRNSYKHLTCGGITTMSSSISETYARDPKFYSGTFCCKCKKHFPLIEFVWEDTNEQVGS